MKMRRLMAIVAVLALLTWLAAPAVRIWLNPSLLKANHAYVGTKACGIFLDQNPFARAPAYPGVEYDAITFLHDLTFWQAYGQLLRTGRSGVSGPCLDHAKDVAPFQSYQLEFQGGQAVKETARPH